MTARQGGFIGKPGKATLAKRNRERIQQLKRQDKEARRAERKAQKADRRPSSDGEDPDLEGLRWGPQPPLF
ncbi:MAG: hypothetical protein ACE5NA_08780 [Nitrospiraceae bacterium]